MVPAGSHGLGKLREHAKRPAAARACLRPSRGLMTSPTARMRSEFSLSHPSLLVPMAGLVKKCFFGCAKFMGPAPAPWGGSHCVRAAHGAQARARAFGRRKENCNASMSPCRPSFRLIAAGKQHHWGSPCSGGIKAGRTTPKSAEFCQLKTRSRAALVPAPSPAAWESGHKSLPPAQYHVPIARPLYIT